MSTNDWVAGLAGFAGGYARAKKEQRREEERRKLIEREQQLQDAAEKRAQEFHESRMQESELRLQMLDEAHKENIENAKKFFEMTGKTPAEFQMYKDVTEFEHTKKTWEQQNELFRMQKTKLDAEIKKAKEGDPNAAYNAQKLEIELQTAEERLKEIRLRNRDAAAKLKNQGIDPETGESIPGWTPPDENNISDVDKELDAFKNFANANGYVQSVPVLDAEGNPVAKSENGIEGGVLRETIPSERAFLEWQKIYPNSNIAKLYDTRQSTDNAMRLLLDKEKEEQEKKDRDAQYLSDKTKADEIRSSRNTMSPYEKGTGLKPFGLFNNIDNVAQIPDTLGYFGGLAFSPPVSSPWLPISESDIDLFKKMNGR